NRTKASPVRLGLPYDRYNRPRCSAPSRSPRSAWSTSRPASVAEPPSPGGRERGRGRCFQGAADLILPIAIGTEVEPYVGTARLLQQRGSGQHGVARAESWGSRTETHRGRRESRRL